MALACAAAAGAFSVLKEKGKGKATAKVSAERALPGRAAAVLRSLVPGLPDSSLGRARFWDYLVNPLSF